MSGAIDVIAFLASATPPDNITVAYFAHSQTGVGEEVSMPWQQMVDRLTRHPDGDKDGGNIVPARMHPRTDGVVGRQAADVAKRTAVLIDIEPRKHPETEAIEEVPPAPAVVAAKLRELGWAGAIYTSHTHTTELPRYRVVLPLAHEMDPKLPVVEVAAERLGLAGVLDRSKLAANSLFYLPRVPPERRDMCWADQIEGTRVGFAEVEREASVRHLAALKIEEGKQQERAATREKRRAELVANGIDPSWSLIEKVRAALLRDGKDIHAVLEGHGYDRNADGRYRHSASGSGNHALYILDGDDGVERAYSFNGTDALHADNLREMGVGSNGAADVLDAITVLEFDGDRKKALHELAKRYGIRPSLDGGEFDALLRDPITAEPVKAKAKFQWLDMDDIETMPDPTWLVDDVLPSVGVGGLFGPPKQGKTFTVLSLALHIAAGKPWFGHKVDQGAVYYIAGEGAGGLKLRIKAARAHYGIPKGVPVHVLTRAAKFTDQGEISDLIASIQDKHRASGVPVRMVVVDTLARAMAGADENGAKDMGLVIEQCDRIRETFSALVMLVHHTGKDLARGMRGSNSLDGAVDCAIKVTREKTPTTDVLTVENLYQKEGPEFADLFFDLVKVADPDGGRGALALTERTEAPVKAKAKAANAKHDLVMQAVRDMAADLPEGAKLDKEAVIERCATDKLITDASRPNDRRRTVGDYLAALVMDQRLAADTTHVWLDEPSVSITELLTQRTVRTVSRP